MPLDPATVHRLRNQGWNWALDAAIAVVCPPGHEGERTCEELVATLRHLYRPVLVGTHALKILHPDGTWR